jgi:tRNA A37 threonylcarbamoyladenosine dehydratase
VHAVDDFVQPDNWPALLPAPVDVLIDACDQCSAKAGAGRLGAGAGRCRWCAWARPAASAAPRRWRWTTWPTTHDPLLASLRQRLRKAGARRGRGAWACAACSRASPCAPAQDGCDVASAGAALACAGYGSSVTVTATFGLVAAGEPSNRCCRRPLADSRPNFQAIM